MPKPGRIAWSLRTARFAAAALALLLGLLPVLAPAQEAAPVTYLRIGTGSTGGSYFPIGGLIANAVSSPPGSRACEDGGSCGVPGLIAVAQSTRGSVENTRMIQTGVLETAFSQADVAWWAVRGEGIFADAALPDLRAIANLYDEVVHLVALGGDEGGDEDGGGAIASVADLKGRRVALGLPGSGTRVDALLILAAFGLKETDIVAVDVGPSQAADLLDAGQLDAFFFIGGYPVNAITLLAESDAIRLVPIAGPKRDALLEGYPFFQPVEIPAGVYPGVGAVESIGIGAQWLCHADLDADLVYALTRALWHPNTATLLENGHPLGGRIRVERAVTGLGVELHEGAARYYREAGMLKPADSE